MTPTKLDRSYFLSYYLMDSTMAPRPYPRHCAATESLTRRSTTVECISTDLEYVRPKAKRLPVYNGLAVVKLSLVHMIRGTLCLLFTFIFLCRNYLLGNVSPNPNELPDNTHLVVTAPLKHAQHLLAAPITTYIKPKRDWLVEPHVSHGYPVRDVWSSEQMCPNDEDFNYWVRVRATRWQKREYREEHNIWQDAVGDKLGGYLFARKMGIRAPRIDFCTGNGPQALEEYKPSPNNGFVVKNLYGHSSKNVYVMETGFGGINRITQKKMTLQDIQRHLKHVNATDIYIEELIQSGRDDGTVPDDYKFYTFNGQVANIRVVRNRGTERNCMAFYDENWNRHDEFGCFRYAYNKPKGNKMDPSTGCYPITVGAANDTRRFCSDIPPPKSFPKMLEMAKRLSKRIGVFMRIDLFEDADGEVVLGEYTPFCSYGGYSCAARVVDGCVDSCFLGRAWKENSLVEGEPYEYKEGWEKRPNGKMVKRSLPPLEGGPITPAPEYLIGWSELSMEEKCNRIKDL